MIDKMFYQPFLRAALMIIAATFYVQAENYAFLSVYHQNKIYKATFPDSGTGFAFTTLADTTSQPRQVAYDPVEKKVYWVELSKMIARCDLDGNNTERYETDGSSPWGLALDVKSRTVYFTDYTNDGVSELAMADFTIPDSASFISATAGDSPRHIAFGTETSYLYVTQSGSSEVIRYDGGPTTLFSTGQSDEIDKPTGIYVDEIAQELFFSDHTERTIYSYNLADMSTKTPIFKGPSASQPRGISVYKDNVYFCDFARDEIYKINKYGMDYPKTTSSIEYTIDGAMPMADSLNGCSDLFFYIEIPHIGFPEAADVCPGEILNVTLQNNGSCNVNVSLSTIDGTAVGGTHFESIYLEMLTVPEFDTVAYEIPIYSSGNRMCGEEQYFQLEIDYENSTLSRDEHIMNITIRSDANCKEISNLTFETKDQICEGSPLSLMVSNNESCSRIITLTAFNGSALSGVDFDLPNTTVMISGMGTTGVYLDIYKDEEFEISNENFEILVQEIQNDEVISNDTFEFKIQADNICEMEIVKIIRPYFGGFRGKVTFDIHYDVDNNWSIKLMFVRHVSKLEIIDCEVEIVDVYRHPGSRRTFYTLGPTSETGALRKGDKFRVEFIATTSNKLRGMAARAIFLPQ